MGKSIFQQTSVIKEADGFRRALNEKLLGSGINVMRVESVEKDHMAFEVFFQNTFVTIKIEDWKPSAAFVQVVHSTLAEYFKGLDLICSWDSKKKKFFLRSK